MADEAAERLKRATEALEAVVGDRGLLGALTVEERTRLLTAAGQVYNPDIVQRRQWGKAVRRREKAEKAERDETVLAETGIRVLRERPVFTTPNVFPPDGFEQVDVGGEGEFREVVEPQHCYVCKQLYVKIHPFYDQLCPACAEFNFRKRTESADLSGRVALLTGGRVKIGYQAGIKLLRAGASLIVTTRFPRDSAARYARESDFDVWSDRLEIFGLDLRHTPSVEAFCHHLGATRDRLDFIVNNACQTVPRLPAARLLPAHARRPRLPMQPGLMRRRTCAGCSGSTRGCAGTTSSRRPGRCRWSASRARPSCPRCCATFFRQSALGSGICSPRAPRPGSAAGRSAGTQLVAHTSYWTRSRLVELLFETQLVNAVPARRRSS